MELAYLRPLSTSVELLGLNIYEPITTLTDILVSIVCVIALLKLRGHSGDQRVLFYFRAFFVSMAAATFVGGIVGHAFYPYCGFYWKLPGWIMSMFSVAFLERVAIERARPLVSRSTSYFFMRLNFFELVAFVAVTIYTMNFYFVEIHAAYGMLVIICGFEGYNFSKTKNHASRLLIIAVSFLVLAALAHAFKLSIGIWFNFFDIGHVLMAASAWYIYKAAKEQI